MINNYVKVGGDILPFDDTDPEQRKLAEKFVIDFSPVNKPHGAAWRNWPTRPSFISIIGETGGRA